MSRPAAPEPARTSLYVFRREQIQALDRAAIEEYGIPGIVLMENAAHHLLEAALRLIDDRSGEQPRTGRRPAPRPAATGVNHPTVLICCGKGNNGGDGFALARLLHNEGIAVQLLLTFDPDPLPAESGPDPSEAVRNLLICKKMQLPMHVLGQTITVESLDVLPRPLSLIVDAILGTGASSAPREPLDQLIEWINRQRPAVPVLAVDIPSGLDCDTGLAPGACINADVTVTFVGLKAGFFELDAQTHLGDVIIGDIGAPPELARRFGQRVETDLDDSLADDAQRPSGHEPRAGKRPGRG